MDLRFIASRSRATRAAFSIAFFGNPVASAACMRSGAIDPSGERIADQIALAKAAFASWLRTTFGFWYEVCCWPCCARRGFIGTNAGGPV